MTAILPPRLKRITPRLLGWVGVVAVLAILVGVFPHGLWADDAEKDRFVLWTVGPCVLSLPWIAGYMAWQLTSEVDNVFWKALWLLVSVVSYAGALLLSMGGYLLIVFVS
jgi:hypothetical protein